MDQAEESAALNFSDDKIVFTRQQKRTTKPTLVGKDGKEVAEPQYDASLVRIFIIIPTLNNNFFAGLGSNHVQGPWRKARYELLCSLVKGTDRIKAQFMDKHFGPYEVPKAVRKESQPRRPSNSWLRQQSECHQFYTAEHRGPAACQTVLGARYCRIHCQRGFKGRQNKIQHAPYAPRLARAPDSQNSARLPWQTVWIH